MNILIIGNGFDLAHDLPTKYENFLDFTNAYLRIPCFDSKYTASFNDYFKRIKKIIVEFKGSYFFKGVV